MDISVMVCGGTFSVVYGNSITCNSANEKFSKIVKIFCVFLYKTSETLYIFVLRNSFFGF